MMAVIKRRVQPKCQPKRFAGSLSTFGKLKKAFNNSYNDYYYSRDRKIPLSVKEIKRKVQSSKPAEPWPGLVQSLLPKRKNNQKTGVVIKKTEAPVQPRSFEKERYSSNPLKAIDEAVGDKIKDSFQRVKRVRAARTLDQAKANFKTHHDSLRSQALGDLTKDRVFNSWYTLAQTPEYQKHLKENNMKTMSSKEMETINNDFHESDVPGVLNHISHNLKRKPQWLENEKKLTRRTALHPVYLGQRHKQRVLDDKGEQIYSRYVTY